jgi:hypothetical protein
VCLPIPANPLEMNRVRKGSRLVAVVGLLPSSVVSACAIGLGPRRVSPGALPQSTYRRTALYEPLLSSGAVPQCRFLSEIQYAKWSTTELYAGCLLTLGKHFELDPYCEHENNTGEGPNQQVKAGGLILNLYY